MSDTLVVFGTTYNNVAGFKATDSSDNTKTYIRPTGTKQITENGTGIDVAAYASVDVAVSGGYTLDEIASFAEPSGDIVLEVAPQGYAFYGRTGIKSITVPSGLNLVTGGSSFYYCSELESVFGDIAYNSSAFRGCTKLKTYVMTNTISKQANGGDAFRGDTSLEAVDLTSRQNVGLSAQLGSNMFNGCSVFDTLILREANIYSLNNVSAFTGTPFANGGTGGDIYIPKALYDALGTGTNDYKAASNWSTVNGYGTITWHAIEGSYYATHYADGTLIPT